MHTNANIWWASMLEHKIPLEPLPRVLRLLPCDKLYSVHKVLQGQYWVDISFQSNLNWQRTGSVAGGELIKFHAKWMLDQCFMRNVWPGQTFGLPALSKYHTALQSGLAVDQIFKCEENMDTAFILFVPDVRLSVSMLKRSSVGSKTR